MASCNYCGSTILLAGAERGTGAFTATAVITGALLDLSQQIPDSSIQQVGWEVHQGACPKCGGSGPVDVHTSYIANQIRLGVAAEVAAERDTEQAQARPIVL